MLKHYTAVIQAGGKGTRLKKLTEDKIPKPLLKINGKPMLEWQIENIRKYGIREVVLITGYLGEKIREYFENGSRWGIHITYIKEKEPLGSAGALYYIKNILSGGNFILLFGDVMFDVDLERMALFHENHMALATLAVHPNTHPFDSDLVLMDDECRITGWEAKTNGRTGWYENLVNAGLYILSGMLLADLDCAKRLDLETDLIMPRIHNGNIYGYRTTEYIKDAGTPERFWEVCQEQEKGIWRRKNLENRQKCVFLDRDGTLNVYKGFISDTESFELEADAAEAVRLINRSGYLAIVVTNQPVVARGMCGLDDVKCIHKKMQVLLGKKGAYLDDIAFCPHHPDRGFPEENPIYKVSCECRKPKTGMIDRMAQCYHIDLSASYIVGDSTADIQTGKNVGLRTILVRTGQAGRDGKYKVQADFEANSLLEAVDWILNREKG